MRLQVLLIFDIFECASWCVKRVIETLGDICDEVVQGEELMRDVEPWCSNKARTGCLTP